MVRHPRGTRHGLLLGLLALASMVPRAGAQQTCLGPGPEVRLWHGALALGGFTLLTALDGGIQDLVQGHRSQAGDAAAGVVRRMGQPEVFLTAGLGVLTAGLVSGDRGLRDAGARISSGLLTAAVLSSGLKLVAGRSRPGEPGRDADDFAPFSGGTSAPSGHTTMAFALATTLSDELHSPVASVLLYAGAAASAWSRVNDNAHWTSDVAAGALVGILGARFGSGRLSFFGLQSPLVRPVPRGIAVGWSGSW